MIIKKIEFKTAAVNAAGYPQEGYPEVAFAGRSNVGKSSLINAMTNRKSIAKISSTPGKTKTINFFNINDNLYFVDLPGYGYANVSKTEKQKWGAMIEKYLLQRETLKLVVSIIDIRHDPTADDIMMIEWIKASGLPLVVVASKADKLSRNQVNKNIASIRKILKMTGDDTLIPFSSVTADGKEELWEKIECLCELNPR